MEFLLLFCLLCLFFYFVFHFVKKNTENDIAYRQAEYEYSQKLALEKAENELAISEKKQMQYWQKLKYW